MVDFVELENLLMEKNREYEELVDKYKEQLIKVATLKNEAKKKYAIAFLKYRAEGENGKKKNTEEEAKQLAILDSFEESMKSDIEKALADGMAEKIEQLKMEIDSLRSILSAYKQTYERVMG
ncbi:MAG TPA: hypothetical protein PK233_08625 [Candidatus Atribacteria bacterium]|nr:hypothetical protein [Candidatus Atribacteria bacterium]